MKRQILISLVAGSLLAVASLAMADGTAAAPAAAPAASTAKAAPAAPAKSEKKSSKHKKHHHKSKAPAASTGTGGK